MEEYVDRYDFVYAGGVVGDGKGNPADPVWREAGSVLPGRFSSDRLGGADRYGAGGASAGGFRPPVPAGVHFSAGRSRDLPDVGHGGGVVFCRTPRGMGARGSGARKGMEEAAASRFAPRACVSYAGGVSIDPERRLSDGRHDAGDGDKLFGYRRDLSGQSPDRCAVRKRYPLPAEDSLSPHVLQRSVPRLFRAATDDGMAGGPL